MRLLLGLTFVSLAACSPNSNNGDVPSDCSGVILSISGSDYCAIEKPGSSADDGPPCPRSHPDLVTNDWSLVVCTDGGSASAAEVYAAYDEQHCRPNANACGGTCERITTSWIVEDDTCTPSAQPICAAKLGSLGDLQDCLERDLGDGRTLAFSTGSIWVEAGWESGSGLCNMCGSAGSTDMGVQD